jgi:4-carboxymuconolactone decarboxylase
MKRPKRVAPPTSNSRWARLNGLTQIEAAEMFAHLAFYAGWPNAMSAVPVATDVFNKRQH